MPGNTYTGSGVQGYIQALEWSDEEKGEEWKNQHLGVELGVRTGDKAVYAKKKEVLAHSWERGVDAMGKVICSVGSQERSRPVRRKTTARAINLMHVFADTGKQRSQGLGAPGTAPRP
ncbi:hypothetical protein NDU88_002276 [Pleurodeles waltl]|uniref:Uncharacterized protein n=1 Tax=Pleurodeles waltl TaxID=8319 RepID=A0AAV7Q8F3_PLEWA|nr:hypothetical protein NDU88_002276 [Pleurodeles waltl]